jgi:hypothetical protein
VAATVCFDNQGFCYDDAKKLTPGAHPPDSVLSGRALETSERGPPDRDSEASRRTRRERKGG